MKRPQPIFRSARRYPRGAVWATVVLVAAVALAGASFGIARATDTPTFCRSACHEMRPYHASWTQGPHAGIACVECHVDPGVLPRLEHKVVALKELQIHVFGDPLFPKATPADVPDSRCIRCHTDVKVTRPDFSHAQHAAKGACQSCHTNVGHDVPATNLRAEGIWSGTITRGASIVRVGSGKADLPGHRSVDCSSCHDMAKTACSTCHTPKHAPRGECTTCHKPGQQFVFYHPSSQTKADCQSCHKVPAKHDHKGACATCHKQAGVSWAFKHPGTQAKCTDCHARPAKHRDGSCTRCHATGVSWKFVHPGTQADCTDCHDRPSGHRSGSCTRCHATGVSWKFVHPGSGSSCTDCHKRPSGHRSGSCTRCHSTGSSWAFRHPSGSASCGGCHSRPSGHRSGACQSCHRPGSWRFRHPSSSSCASCHHAPSNHYGSSCAACHSPSRSFSNAHFSHPGIPGGEHSYRSFACSNCHPGGYSSHTCAKCHDSKSGPRED